VCPGFMQLLMQLLERGRERERDVEIMRQKSMCIIIISYVLIKQVLINWFILVFYN